MNCPAVFQVAHKSNAQVFQAALLLDSIKVQKRLGGMVASAVACVKHGHGRELGSQAGGALLGMAYDQGIGIPSYHSNGIGEGLSLGD